MAFVGAQSLKIIKRHPPITTPNSGNAAARRVTISVVGLASGKVWVQSSVTVWVLFGTSSVDATGGNSATTEVEIQAGSPVPLLDCCAAGYVSVYAASDARVTITEVG